MKTIVSRKCPDFWDDFVSRHSPLVFHRSVWADVLRDGYESTPLFCWLEDESNPRLALLGGIMDFRAMKIFYAALPYGGFAGDTDVLKIFTDGFLTAMIDEGIHQIRIAEPGCRAQLEPLGFEATELARHVTDLRPFDSASLLEALPRSVRKNIRRSRQSGVAIDELTEEADLGDVFALYLKTMAQNHAAAKYPAARFNSIFKHFVNARNGAILVARHEGRIIGANTLVCSDDTVHDIQLSHDADYQHLRVADALVLASFEWTMRRRLAFFDFMGSPPGDEALERYKTKWLAARRATYTYTRTLSPLRSLLWTAAQAFVSHPVGAWVARRIRGRQRNLIVAKRHEP